MSEPKRRRLAVYSPVSASEMLPSELHELFQEWLDLPSRLTLACTSKARREVMAQSTIDLRGLMMIQPQDLITRKDFLSFWRVLGLEISQLDNRRAVELLPPTLEHLDIVRNLDFHDEAIARHCPNLESLALLCGLNDLIPIELKWFLQLKKLQICGARNLASLPPNIEEIVISCVNSTEFSAMQKAPRLKKLCFSCYKNIDMSQVNPGLEELSTFGSNQTHDIERLPHMPNLHTLGLGSIDGVPALKRITSLTSLNIRNNVNITDLEALSDLTGLTKLNMGGCSQVNDFTFLRSLHKLVSLDLSSSKIDTLKDLIGCKRLRTLKVFGCTALHSFNGLESGTELVNLDAHKCSLLASLSGLQVSKLQRLNITDTKVDNLSPLSGAIVLRILEMRRISGVDFSPLKRCSRLEFLDIRLFTNVKKEPNPDISMLPKTTRVKIFSLVDDCVLFQSDCALGSMRLWKPCFPARGLYQKAKHPSCLLSGSRNDTPLMQTFLEIKQYIQCVVSTEPYKKTSDQTRLSNRKNWFRLGSFTF